jgi:formylglycine-generating enzyme required for sulfatase activity
MSGSYADLEIRILSRQDEGYPVEITVNNAQEFPRGYLNPDCLPWVLTADPAQDGERLFQWLFADDALKTAWAEVRSRYPQRRVRLRIDATAPELHAIPWELLRDAEGVVPQDIAAATATPFSRYLAGTWPPGRPILERPIKILVAIANPQDLVNYDAAPIDGQTEWEALQNVTVGLDVELAQVPVPCTLANIESALKKGCHILHIVAHGRYDHAGNAAELYLADDHNRVMEVWDDDFAAMLARQLAGVNAQQSGLQLVFLASCQTATRSPADAFRGFAPSLVAAGVPAVLAMQDLVPVPTAQAFTRVFYRQLFQHGLADLACNEARSALISARLSGAAIPVLLSRSDENRLLAFPENDDRRPAIALAPFEPETRLIPAGLFLMGSTPGPGVPDNEMPQHEVDLPAYRIGVYPVTNAQYAEFVRQTGTAVSPETGWELAAVGQVPPAGKENHPVVGVSWDQAAAYCAWLAERTGRRYCLPSEALWEKAARGTDGRRYPWGDEFDAARCNGAPSGHRGTTPVGHFAPGGDSVYGCADVAGNVWEWTSTQWGRERPRPDFVYPYRADDRRERRGPVPGPYRELRICRGGSFRDRPTRLTVTTRARVPADNRHPARGFRVAMEIRSR